MRIHLVCLTLALAALAVNSAGCLVVAAGAGAAGAVAYARGDLETEEPYQLEAVYAATRQATKQLELSVLEGKTAKDALSATLVARDASDKRVTINLKARSERTTKVSIRIGTFGDQTKSHMIYNRIRENLKAMEPQPAQAPPQSEPPAGTVPSVAPPVATRATASSGPQPAGPPAPAPSGVPPAPTPANPPASQ